ncbi:hypothetical protein C8R43DRAFT_1084702 [Mycena crocata]|nr:hypothetical protein C8R43DRAFT_1084702 [Mycena crocata]
MTWSLLPPDAMSELDAPQAVSGPAIQALSLVQTLRFVRLLSRLKQEIILVSVAYYWQTMRKDIWELPQETLSAVDEGFFRTHGWKISITSTSLYPPSHHCTNFACSRHKPLKRATSQQVVVYTVASGVVPAWETHLYCPDCNTTYYSNFSSQHGMRTYYGGVPNFIQIGVHQFAERKLIALWTTLMLVAWVSATNCSQTYDMALSGQEEHDFASGGWQFGCVLTTDHVWDAFIILMLLEYHDRRDTLLQVPHTGDQKNRYTTVMESRNLEVIQQGQEGVVGHCCNKCMREWTNPDGTITDVQAIISDGLAMGHIHCQSPHCTVQLANNRDRFCPTHKVLEKICSIVGCDRAVVPGTKSCDISQHSSMEKLHYERGKAAFTLHDRLQRHRIAHPNSDADAEVKDEEDMEWFEMAEGGNVRVRREGNPGSVGVTDDACEAAKSDTGNRKFKALFGRCRTHNEQILVWPCGVIFARATFYHAEAVSNVLLFTEKAFSVPGAIKPEHFIYDTNCDAKQQVNAHPDDWSWWADVGMTVDVFHFLNKHNVGHTFCQANCNPMAYPELLKEDGKTWYFNTSVAEQTNMLPTKYNFFLDEMIRLRNQITLSKLADGGHNRSSLVCSVQKDNLESLLAMFQMLQLLAAHAEHAINNVNDVKSIRESSLLDRGGAVRG